MTGVFVQDAIVTAVMLGALATVARRVFGFVAIKDGAAGKAAAGCDKCASGPGHERRQAAAARAGASGGVTVHPVVLLRKPTSSRTTSA